MDPAALKDDNRMGFQVKYIDICDPLCNKNNLGRSVSRSSSYRLPRVFRRGHQQLMALLSAHGVQAFFVYTLTTLKGHRPDVGDMCIPGEFNLRGSSTMSSRSTDQCC